MDNEHTNLEINAVICGMTSVGKSTFLNALCKRQYAETGIKPTTMKPHLYSSVIKSDTSGEVKILTTGSSSESHGSSTTKSDTLGEVKILTTDSTTKSDTLGEVKILTTGSSGLLAQSSESRCGSIMKSDAFEIKLDSDKNDLLIRHQIDPLSDLLENTNIIFNIIDLPGLSYKNIDWLIENIKSFNVIIFMTDIGRGLRDREEVDHIEKIISKISSTSTKLVCIMNKCDDIFYDSDNCELIFEEKEIQEIFIQSNQILDEIVKKYNCQDNVTSFLPACAENEFIYRMLHSGRINELDSYYHVKLCKNECGSNSWKNMTLEEKNSVLDYIFAQTEHIFGNTITFDNVNQHLKKIIDDNLEIFIRENIIRSEDILKSTPHSSNEEYIALINKIENLHQQFFILFHKNIRSSMLKNIECHIEEYIRDIINYDARIVKAGYYIRFNLFKQTMDKFQRVYCEFVELANFIKIHFNEWDEPNSPPIQDEYQTYTERFLIEHEKILRDKNLFIFDQILLLNVTNTEYTYPFHFLGYLKFIQKNIPDKFDYYANGFLEIICKNIKLIYTENIKRDCINLINFINEHGKTKIILLKQIYKILINRHYQVNHEGYENTFYYHVNLKHKINIMVMHNELSIDDGMLCLIMEIIEKSISMMISIRGIRGLYNQEIDYGKVNILLDSAVQYNLLADVNLENGLLKVIADIHKNIYFNS